MDWNEFPVCLLVELNDLLGIEFFTNDGLIRYANVGDGNGSR